MSQTMRKWRLIIQIFLPQSLWLILSWCMSKKVKISLLGHLRHIHQDDIKISKRKVPYIISYWQWLAFFLQLIIDN